MMECPTVLLPLDGSELADHAIPYAAGLAELFGHAVHLLAVVGSIGFEAIDGRPSSPEIEAQRAHLDGVARRLTGAGVACHISVEPGDPAEVILRRAGESACRAVVMATHGGPAVDRAVLGSVADAVGRGAPVPVLVIGPDVGHTVREPWRPRRLLLPLDGSEFSEAALAPANAIAARADAEIILASVTPWITVEVAQRVLAGTRVSTAEVETTRIVAEYLREVREQALAGQRVREAVLRGRAPARLVEFARKEGVDLVVMTSHRRVGLERFARGSVADRLIWAGLPVYLVPTPAPPIGDRV